jgi:hypothetical protein
LPTHEVRQHHLEGTTEAVMQLACRADECYMHRSSPSYDVTGYLRCRNELLTLRVDEDLLPLVLAADGTALDEDRTDASARGHVVGQT